MTLTMWFSDIKTSEVIFKEQIHWTENTLVFLIELRGHTCVMKVHRNQGHYAYDASHETNIHVCERKAYQRFAQHGLSARGLVPTLLGVIENINPEDWDLMLGPFLFDEFPPNAIILEYIPGMSKFWIENYSRKRAEGFIHLIQEIHKAGVVHDDIYPRNMIVFDDDPERVMWIDFDRAQVDDGSFYTPESIQRLMKEEDALVRAVCRAVEEDSRLGRLDRCLILT